MRVSTVEAEKKELLSGETNGGGGFLVCLCKLVWNLAFLVVSGGF